jgi:hypothetical protein
MAYSTLHWKPMVNSYAGIEPRSYVQMRELSRAFAAEGFLQALRGVGVRYIALHRRGYGPNQSERLQQGLPTALTRGLMRELGTFGNDIVCELQPLAPTGD